MVRWVILLNRALGRSGGLLKGVDSVTGITMHLLMLLEGREGSWEGEGKGWLAVVLLVIVILKTLIRERRGATREIRWGRGPRRTGQRPVRGRAVLAVKGGVGETRG